jgi:cell division protein FtsB
LKSQDIDPDMLDEQARMLLGYADPRELTMTFGDNAHQAAAAGP